MFPIKMYYKDSTIQQEGTVDVYSIEHVCTEETIDSIVTAWNSKTCSWITAPIWYFKPIDKTKTLME